MEEKIVSVINEMAEVLNVHQLKKLQESLLKNFSDNTFDKTDISNELYLSLFLSAKQIEGCSERTVKYYSDTIHNFFKTIDGPVRKMTTEAIREYLVNYQKARDCSRITIDNIRRISSFFTWLEEEDYILKSPMRRIHKIKTAKVVKQTISDEAIEKLRDSCEVQRDLAIIDLLYSTGIRVGELVKLNREDIDFAQRECIVLVKVIRNARYISMLRLKFICKIKVVSERKVEYVGEITSLSAITDRLRGHSTQGPWYFTYRGRRITDIAEETQWKNY